MKRVVDFLIAFVGLIFLSPVLGIVALLVRVFLGSPVLFRQVRPGLNGEGLELVKFRSMTERRDSNGEFISDSQRLTGFGRFLRATSLDELPELWNVVKGDMSLVGPRPLLVEYLPRYSTTQSRRHEVRPGVTGLAQVRGRNNLSWEGKFDLDVWYVDNRSARLDLAILFWTIKSVFMRSGVSADGSATMPPFTGSD
jgi:lipopolysaccharide/colanic/teichoic acid biosynthesis glycosyltransferase